MLHKYFRLPIIILIFWIQANIVVWARTEKITAFVNVNLVPMTTETVIPDSTVLVKGMRIIEIGSSSRIDIAHNSKIINGSNAYLLPGLGRRYHAAGRLGPGLQWAVGTKSVGTGLSFAGPGVQIKVIPHLARARQDRPVLATEVV